MASSILIQQPYASNFEEVSRHIADHHDGDVPYPTTFAARLFVNRYIEDHPDDFAKKDRQIIYIGGDSAKGGIPDDDTETATLQDGQTIEEGSDDDDGDDGDKITFSMSEGYDSE